MTVLQAEPTAMGRKKSAGPRPQKTLKCSEATWKAVRDVAQMRDIDIADYVDLVLGPIAEKDRRAEARKILGKDA